MFDAINRVSIEFTKYCNMRCKYCHQGRGERTLTMDELKTRVEFVNSLKIFAPKVDFALTGGEVTAFGEQIKEQYRYVRDNVSISNKTFSMMSNMTNIDIVMDLMEEGILRPDRVGFSWDGVKQSSSRSGSGYTDEFFNDQVIRLAKSKYRKDIFVQISLHPSAIENLPESVQYLRKNGITNIGTYMLRGVPYTKEDADLYDRTMEKVADIYVDSYLNDTEKLRYFEITKCWIDYVCRKDLPISVTTSCQKIGKSLHLGMDESIYPCIYFGDHDLFPIGNLKDGICEESLVEFEKEYWATPECIEKNKCTMRNCNTCEAVNFHKRGKFQSRDETHCDMRKIEQKWFGRIIGYLKPCITDYDMKTYWSKIDEQALVPNRR